MLSLLHAVSGRPWAVDATLAAHVRGLLARDGIAGLRHLADIKAAVHATDGRSRVRSSSAGVSIVRAIGTLTQRPELVGSTETRSTEALAAEVRQAMADRGTDAVVVEFDSGGGEVFGVPECFDALRSSRASKPLVASVNSMAASAAYWLACAAQEVVCTPSGVVGSVGVYALHVDMSRRLDAEGEKWTFVSSEGSPFKVEGNPSEPLSEDARATMQADVDRYFDMFVRDVARGRGVGVETVRRNFGRGRTVGAREAVALGMADSVGTLGDAVRRAAALAGGASPASSARGRATLPAGFDSRDARERERAVAAELLGLL